MIDRHGIIDTASALGLQPHIVEKDYVLGWLLWGISKHELLAETWMFKGGTCLKKCFVETYRFSEDLDFTLVDESHLRAEFLSAAFAEISGRVYERTGIEFPEEYRQFDIYTNLQGGKSCEARIGYRGPISPRGKNMPRIRLDLTSDERVLIPPVQSAVHHPYLDLPDGGINAQTYAYDEVFAEKIRALADRKRPRDLYDVINLFRYSDARPDTTALRELVRQKCEYKGMNFPALSDLEPHKTDLGSAWEAMLAHQLPALPPLEAFWTQLPTFFAWLHGKTTPAPLPTFPVAAGERIIQQPTLSLPLSTKAKSQVEKIRFAASNHLCVDLTYQGSTERVEPYALHLDKDGDIVLYARGIHQESPRSYRAKNIQNAQVTGQNYTPRFKITLTPAARPTPD